jgi:hypothetical protein
MMMAEMMMRPRWRTSGDVKDSFDELPAEEMAPDFHSFTPVSRRISSSRPWTYLRLDEMLKPVGDVHSLR